MSTDAIVILAFLGLDFGAVLVGLFYLAEQRSRRDVTDLRRRNGRHRE